MILILILNSEKESTVKRGFLQRREIQITSYFYINMYNFRGWQVYLEKLLNCGSDTHSSVRHLISHSAISIIVIRLNSV